MFLIGNVDRSRGDTQVQVERIIPGERAGAHLATRLEIGVDATALTEPVEGVLQQLVGLLKSRAALAGIGGNGAGAVVLVPVRLSLRTAPGTSVAIESASIRITPTPDLVRDLGSIVGPDRVSVVGGMPIQRVEPRTWSKPNGQSHGAHRNGSRSPAKV